MKANEQYLVFLVVLWYKMVLNFDICARKLSSSTFLLCLFLSVLQNEICLFVCGCCCCCFNIWRARSYQPESSPASFTKWFRVEDGLGTNLRNAQSTLDSTFPSPSALIRNLSLRRSAISKTTAYESKGRGNFSCNLSRNKRCETSCKKDWTCNTPVLQPATATKCWVASCKKRRNILKFSQRCETSYCVWQIHRNLQRNFVKMSQSECVFCSREIQNWRPKIEL